MSRRAASGRLLAVAAVLGLFAVLAGCGSGGGGLPPTSTGGGGSAPPPPGANVAAITVGPGPAGNYANGVFTTVRVCVPGTSQCQNIQDVLVDTGSYGLRLLGSEVGINLPYTQDTSGNTIAECTQFQGSYVWGPVATADVSMGGSNNQGEQAASVPVQIIAPSGFNAVPGNCPNGLPANDDVTSLGANGILGIGIFRHDCGAACAPGAASPPSPQPYYSCSSSTCTPVPLPETDQVQNPVWLFANDNNGIAVKLPAIAAGGVPSAAGTLTFGLGTESNNGLGSATVLTVNCFGDVSTIYNGVTYSDNCSASGSSGNSSTNQGSFFDTGSNGLYILDAATLGQGIVDCPQGTTAGTSYYCPPSPVNLTATNVGVTPSGGNGATAPAPFTIANANNLFSNTTAFAFSDLGGAYGSGTEAFDWGLPFFFGRTVFFAINGAQTPQGPGPYYAY